MTAQDKTGINRRAPWPALAAIALALLLGGCDKCGDWFGISRSHSAGSLESCRDTGPPQQH